MTALVVIFQLIFLEGLLSLDNAAVLGAMAAPLPDDCPVPWPKRLGRLRPALDRLCGPQRTAALKVGLLGAYLGRGLMLVLAAWVVHNLWLKLLGALYLIKLAADHLGRPAASATQKAPATSNSRFWQVVLAIELADLAFSLDNVVAAVALSDWLPVVMLGVAIGILMMRFAAGVFSHLVEKEPILGPAAYVLVLNIGLELLLEEFTGVQIGDLTRFVISAGTLVLALVYAHWQPLRSLAPILRAASWCLWTMNEVLKRAARPITSCLSTIIMTLLPGEA